MPNAIPGPKKVLSNVYIIVYLLALNMCSVYVTTGTSLGSRLLCKEMNLPSPEAPKHSLKDQHTEDPEHQKRFR